MIHFDKYEIVLVYIVKVSMELTTIWLSMEITGLSLMCGVKATIINVCIINYTFNAYTIKVRVIAPPDVILINVTKLMFLLACTKRL